MCNAEKNHTLTASIMSRDQHIYMKLHGTCAYWQDSRAIGIQLDDRQCDTDPHVMYISCVNEKQVPTDAASVSSEASVQSEISEKICGLLVLNLTWAEQLLTNAKSMVMPPE